MQDVLIKKDYNLILYKYMENGPADGSNFLKQLCDVIGCVDFCE
ncbi:hypothetical protein Hanom_Chr12g01094131 [Helianthus anomalus]